MSVEIDIIIRQFDYFNIDSKVEIIRHKAISNLSNAKNDTKAIQDRNEALNNLKKNIIHQNICQIGLLI